MPEKFIKFNKDSCFKETIPETSTILAYKINETKICDEAFKGLTLPNFNTYDATSIGENAYKDSKGFDKIFISKAITYIGPNAFSGTDINEIIFEPEVTIVDFASTAFSGLSGPLNVFYDSTKLNEEDIRSRILSDIDRYYAINEFCFAKTIDNQNWIIIDNSNNKSQITTYDISATLINNSLEKKDLKDIIFST